MVTNRRKSTTNITSSLQILKSNEFQYLFLFHREMMLQLQYRKMNCSIFLLILFHVKKQQKLIRKKNQSAKFNILLLYQHQQHSEMPFNCPMDKSFNYLKIYHQISLQWLYVCFYLRIDSLYLSLLLDSTRYTTTTTTIYNRTISSIRQIYVDRLYM